MRITATVEREEDGSWTASTHIGDELILGDGDTQGAAVASLKAGLDGWVEYMKSSGNSLPQIVTVEVAT